MGDLISTRRKQSILIVDDHRLNAELLREMLIMRGYHASVVASAGAAEDRIRAEAPDLILLDVIMPGKTGYELCHELKENPATRLIPVVMITGLNAHEDRLNRSRPAPTTSSPSPSAPKSFSPASNLF